MKNDPRENSEQPEAGEEEAETPPPPTELTAEEGRRLEAFQARCELLRQSTERELARLAKRRANARAQIGVTAATMEQWTQEHQQMVRDRSFQ